MNEYNIYEDIAKRTNGDIYIGVVGPVRTGKSTFIKRFMDLAVIPNIKDVHKQERAKDELPQSASGRTIMTTEPKFIPNEAVTISLDNNIKMNVRLVDCVGYLVDGAIGHLENDAPRMITTPWFEEKIPFENAAEIGTQKVINEHSTIGLVVTTDGTISEISRESYIKAEERVINELKELNKPFAVLLNSAYPDSQETINLKNELEEKYGTTVIIVDCMSLDEKDINEILEKLLLEFPVEEVNLCLPDWLDSLDISHWLKFKLLESMKEIFYDVKNMKNVTNVIKNITECENIEGASILEIDMGKGCAKINLTFPEELFYKILSELADVEIKNQSELVQTINEMSKVKHKYDKIAYALNEVEQKGYGIVTPSMDEMMLEEPEIIKQGGRFGVKLKASAPSIHMIRADIETEVSPIVGSEKQSEDLVEYLMSEFESDPKKIWESNIFGKSLHELISEGLHNKLYKMPEDAQEKLQETLQRIINEGSGGLICIIL
ncbi:MAG: stage IV sporulation protein A [Clostridiales bacterium]|nr:stage IV sporulation protein A [Clostridiales bacterium]